MGSAFAQKCTPIGFHLVGRYPPLVVGVETHWSRVHLAGTAQQQPSSHGSASDDDLQIVEDTTVRSRAQRG